MRNHSLHEQILNSLTCKAMDSKHDISKLSIKFKRFACLEAVKPKDIDVFSGAHSCIERTELAGKE